MGKKLSPLEQFRKTAFLNYSAKTKFGLPTQFSATSVNPGIPNGFAVKNNFRGFGAEGVSLSVLAKPKLPFTRG